MVHTNSAESCPPTLLLFWWTGGYLAILVTNSTQLVTLILTFTGALALILGHSGAVQAGPVHRGAPAECSGSRAGLVDNPQEQVGAWHCRDMVLATMLSTVL